MLNKFIHLMKPYRYMLKNIEIMFARVSQPILFYRLKRTDTENNRVCCTVQCTYVDVLYSTLYV